jgi:sec-independent protein translocase protein TatB
MFDIGWTEILILATVSLFVIGPKEIPKFLGYIGKMIAKVKGVTRELQETVDDAIQNSELEDIRKEISLTDPELSKNLKEIMEPNTPNNISKDNAKNEEQTIQNEKKLVSNNTTSHKTSIKTSKQDFPTGLKHIRNSELEEEETNQDNLSNKT